MVHAAGLAGVRWLDCVSEDVVRGQVVDDVDWRLRRLAGCFATLTLAVRLSSTLSVTLSSRSVGFSLWRRFLNQLLIYTNTNTRYVILRIITTSVKSNLARGRIAFLSPLAAANAFVRRVRWAGHSPSGSRRTMCRRMPPQKCPIWCLVPWTHMNQPPNGIWIGSAVFAQLTRVANTRTDRQTDHATCDICNNRPHLCVVSGDAAYA